MCTTTKKKSRAYSAGAGSGSKRKKRKQPIFVLFSFLTHRFFRERKKSVFVYFLPGQETEKMQQKNAKEKSPCAHLCTDARAHTHAVYGAVAVVGTV